MAVRGIVTIDRFALSEVLPVCDTEEEERELMAWARMDQMYIPRLLPTPEEVETQLAAMGPGERAKFLRSVRKTLKHIRARRAAQCGEGGGDQKSREDCC